MRFLCITYIKKPDGQVDEATTLAKSLKRKDLSTSSVILDFKEKKIIKASFSGSLAEKNWGRIRDFYYEFYPKYIDLLEAAYETIEEVQNEVSTETENNPD
jgi:hypothetical protein